MSNPIALATIAHTLAFMRKAYDEAIVCARYEWAAETKGQIEVLEGDLDRLKAKATLDEISDAQTLTDAPI